MRSKTLLVLLLTSLALWQPHLPMTNGDPVTRQVTLYAHTDPSAISVQGRVLSLSGNATSRGAADVREGLGFTLVPALSVPLHIRGGAGVYVWLLAQASVRGTLRVGISEITANATAIEIRSTSVTLPALPSSPFLVILGLGAANYTAGAGSTLRLDVQFSPEKPVPVSLLWDHPSTQTRLLLQVETIPKIEITVTDASGKPSTVFAEDVAGTAKLTVQASVEEPFGRTNIQMLSLTLTNSSGHTLIEDSPMNLTSRVEPPFPLGYSLPVSIPSGRFNITITLLDVARRTFVTVKEVTVTRFHKLVLFMVDAQGRPLPDLTVSFSSREHLIDEVRTNSSGAAVLRLPSSRTVGPLTVLVQKGSTVILAREIDFESDSVLQLEAPLSDWTLAVRFRTLDVPVAGARVELYLNGTLLASNRTDTNGVVLFTGMPPGSYEISITSALASKRFLNVTHSRDISETVLQLPVIPLLPGIPENMLLPLAAIAIVAVITAFAATSKRFRRRRFKHVSDLLGGKIPTPAVLMIVGASGSGKTLLLENILADSLRLGKRCVYASNSELPSKIKDRLARMGVETRKYQGENMLRFVDGYSGGTGMVSSERHFVSSPKDLTALGIQLSSSLEEVGGVGDVFLDSLGPIVALGDPTQALNFVQYYGARILKSGGNFLFVATDTIEADLLGRFEEASDCVLQTDKFTGPKKIRGRLLVKKARGVEHYEDWVGLKIASSGRIEFVSLPAGNH